MTRFSWYLAAKVSLYTARRLMEYSYLEMEFQFIESDILGCQDIRRSTARYPS